MSRQRILAVLAAVAIAVTTAPAASAAEVSVTDLGPASEVTSTSSAEQIGGHIYTATSGVSPVIVGAFNVDTHVIDRTFALPSGAGVWAMTHIGTDLYLGTYTPGDLYKLDTISGTVTKVANFGPFIWSIAASPDGKIFAGTYPDGGVYEYDPATGATRSFGQAVSGEQYVRSIAVSETTIYAGVGSHAHLISIDRVSGAKTEALPTKYANRTFVATLDLSGDRLVAGLSPTGTMLIFDTDDMTNPIEVQTTDQYVTAITIEPTSGDVYFGTRPSGTFYRYRGSAVERLGSPYEGAYFNRILLDGSTIRASLTSQIVEFTGEFVGYDLVTAGLPAAPELAMQLTATKDKVLVSGKAGIQIHDVRAKTSRRIFLTGEAKTMTPVGDRVYLGVYTLARLFSMNPDGTSLAPIVDIENEQTRPTDAVFDERSRLLLMATEADYGKYNGALALFDPRTQGLEVYRGVVPNQSLRSVTVLDRTAYLGSEIRNSLGTDPIVPTATLSGFDLVRRTVQWQITPVEGAKLITDVMAYRGKIYGTTDNGKLFEFDPATRQVTAVVTIGTGQSTLVIARDKLYGTDGKRVFAVTPTRGGAPAVSTVVDGLAATTYSYPIIEAAPDGESLFTIAGRNLVRVWLA